MKTYLAFVLMTGLAAWTAAEAGPGSASAVMAREAAETVADWPMDSRLAARKMLEKYGPPNACSPIALTWNDKGPWSWIVVHRYGRLGGDVLGQFVRYEVPLAWRPSVWAFGHGVSYDAQSKELSAHSDSEEKNFLALNLADEIVTGSRDVESAEAFYDKTLALSLSGKSSRYMRTLFFRPRRSLTRGGRVTTEAA